jgi:hypothetical protein
MARFKVTDIKGAKHKGFNVEEGTLQTEKDHQRLAEQREHIDQLQRELQLFDTQEHRAHLAKKISNLIPILDSSN